MFPWPDPDDDEFWDDDEHDDGSCCPRCYGDGEIITCPDDMCRAMGGCDKPGKGCFMVCPDCGDAG